MRSHTVVLGERNPGSIVVGLFVESLNEVIDIYTKRVTVGVRNRIPGVIWLALLAVAVIALAQWGTTSASRGRADRSHKSLSPSRFLWSSGSLRTSIDHKRGPLR